ncbi:unnamed protein product [Parnassius mnemosyne]|uniref:Reverse transcriptase domain-containing protein n=1 Tax=Parnassius mnemosyne TaxID=213953 RepID=A0AAV1LR50_9NEOP
MFWKLVRTTRGHSQQPRMNAIRDQNGCILNDEVLSLRRWKEYFESVFMSDETIELNEIEIPKEEEIDRDISIDEIMKAMKSMKAGKAAGYDRVSLEMLRAGEGVVADLLYTLFNLCWELKRVPGDWCKAVIVPIYKGKGSQQDCRNYRGISLLSIVGKLYAKVLIERVMKETDGKIWDVQAGFRKGMGCTDQVFSTRMIAEKFLAKNQKVFCAFMDLEKAYDRVDRDVLWQTLNSFGLTAGLIQALKSLYRDSSACVRINGAYSDWFDIHKGVRQGCVASPWLFNLFMDSCLENFKVEECGLRMGELTVKCLLYADDQVILASSAAELQIMVTLMNRTLKEKGMKVNRSKTKVMVFEREESKTICEIRIEGELVEQVDEFVYLGCVFSRDGRYDKDIERRVNAGNRVNGALHSIVKSQNVSKKARMAIHNAVLVPTLMYGSESWVWQKKHESRINAVEMRSLRSMLGMKLNRGVATAVSAVSMIRGPRVTGAPSACKQTFQGLVAPSLHDVRFF